MTRAEHCIAILLFAGGWWAVPVAAQPPARNPLNEPVISLCAECDDLQKQVIDQVLVVRDLDSAWTEARRRLGEAKDNLAKARVDLEYLPKAATQAERQAAQARVIAMEAAATAAEALYNQLESRWQRAVDEWVRRRSALDSCNTERCPKPPPSGGPAGTGTAGAPVSTTGEAQAPGPPQCPDCAKLVAELDRIRYLIWLWQDTLDGLRDEHSRLGQQRDQLQAQRKQMAEAAQSLSTPDPSVSLSGSDIEAQLKKLDWDAATLSVERSGIDDEMDDIQDTLRDLRRQRDEWFSDWEYCNRSCGPAKNPWFTRPLLWVPIAGVVGGVAVAGGGDTPTGTATAPPSAPAPTSVTPAPPPTLPSERRPASRLSVIGCTCITNSANFDAILELCRLLRQLRAESSGTTMALSGDAPLPAFQGAFNPATGEFELTSTTMVGSAMSTVVIAGTVEAGGNIHNLRVSFAGSGGRQTLYQLTVTPVQ